MVKRVLKVCKRLDGLNSMQEECMMEVSSGRGPKLLLNVC